MKLEHYIQKQNWVEGMMRKVDPDIVTIASGDLGNGWSEGLLKGSMHHMDHIAEHFYVQEKPRLVEHVRQVPDRIKNKADAHRLPARPLPS